MIDIDNDTIELCLLSGTHLPITSQISIKPIFLGDIKNIGWKTYSKHIGFLTLPKESLTSAFPETMKEEMEGLSLWGTYFWLASHPILHDTFKKDFISALEFCLGVKITWEKTLKGFYIHSGDNVIELTEELFSFFVKIINVQNSGKLEDITVTFKPANEATRRVLAKQEAARKKMSQRPSSSGDEPPTSFGRIIAGICAKSTNGLNLFNIWDITIFAMYVTFDKLCEIEQYELDFHTALAGVKDVKLKHWSS